MAKETIKEMTEENFKFILQNYNEKAKEWCNSKGKKYNEWHKTRAKETLIEELKKLYTKWQPLQ